MKSSIVYVVLAVALMGAGVALWLAFDRRPTPAKPIPSTPVNPVRVQEKAPAAVAPAEEAPAPKPKADPDDGLTARERNVLSQLEKRMTPEQKAAAEKIMAESRQAKEPTEADRAQIAAIEAAAEKGESNAAVVLKLAAEAVSVKSAAVREAAVEALKEMGEAGMSGLTPFLADADESVRAEAFAAWQAELIAMKNGEAKAVVVAAVMQALNDETVLEPIGQQILTMDHDWALSVLDAVDASGSKAGRAVAERLREALGEQDK